MRPAHGPRPPRPLTPRGARADLLLVSGWFYLELDPRLLAPVFFADPAGAVVGKTLSRHLPALNPPWYQKKTARSPPN